MFNGQSKSASTTRLQLLQGKPNGGGQKQAYRISPVQRNKEGRVVARADIKKNTEAAAGYGCRWRESGRLKGGSGR